MTCPKTPDFARFVENFVENLIETARSSTR